MSDAFVEGMRRRIAENSRITAMLTGVPCPFCGYVGAILKERKREHQGEYSSKWWVQCGNDFCNCSGRQHKSDVEAAKEWLRVAGANIIAEAAWLEREASKANGGAPDQGRPYGPELDLRACAVDAWGRLLDERGNW